MSAHVSSPAPTGSTTSGRLTTAMRAARWRSNARVFRIARRVEGRIVDERVHDARCEISVGPTLDATFVTPEASHTMRVLRSTPEKRVLELHDGMRGRIVTDRGLIDLADAFHRGVRTIDLDDEARGRIELCGVTMLVQIVEPPPPKTRAQLPITVRAAANMDWKFATLAAFSFLAHFAFAAAVDGDWFDPSVDDGAEAAQLVETTTARPNVALEQPPDPTTDPTTSQPTTTSNATNVASNAPHPTNGKPEKPGVGVKSPGLSDNASTLTNTLDQLETKAIGSWNAHGPATSIVLKPGASAVDAQLDELMKKKNGVTMDGGALKIPPGGTPTIGQPIGDTTCLTCIGDAKPAPIPTTKPPADPTAPPPKVPDPIPQPPTGNVPDAETVIAKNRWRFTACFRKVVAVSDDPGGTVKVLVQVGEGGEVISASPMSTNASPALTQCIVGSFYSMKFAAPDGGTGQFSVPIVMHSK